MTLLELLVAISLLGVVVLGINNLGVFSHNQFVYSERRTKVQNDVSRCLEHMTKNLSRAIGNEALSSTLGLVAWMGVSGGTYYLTVREDTNNNGITEGWGVDNLIGYKQDLTTHQLSYCTSCFDSPCSSCLGTSEVLANNVTAFSAAKNLSSGSNYITVDLTTCWDPDGTCGTAGNPSVSMSSSIVLPSVAAN